MKIYFYLEPSINLRRLRVKINHSGLQKSFKSPFKIDLSYWDNKNKYPTRKHPKYIQISRWQSKLQESLMQFFDELSESGEFEWNQFLEITKLLIDDLDINKDPNTLNTYQKVIKKETTLIMGIDMYIDEIEIKNSRSYASNLKQVKTHLHDFEKNQNKIFTFEDVNYGFMSDFNKHLTLKRNKNSNEYGLKINTVGNILKKFKGYMKWAKKRDLHQQHRYEHYPIKFEESHSIALTMEQVKSLSLAQLNGNQDKVRDIFLFLVYTAQRINVLKQLSWSAIHIEDGIFTYRDVKNGSINKLYLNRQALKILLKYKKKGFHRPLPLLQPNTINRHLKQIFKQLGHSHRVQIDFTKGGNRKTTDRPFYELVSSHTGRRTYATLAINKGANDYEVQQMTGHKDVKTFRKYVKNSHFQRSTILDSLFDDGEV